MTQRCALVMAGGTGGHIFPGLAVADALRERGWRVHWLGAPGSMEQQLVPPRGYPFEAVAFGGVRGKGALTLALLPLRLLRAFARSIGVIRRVKPDVLVCRRPQSRPAVTAAPAADRPQDRAMGADGRPTR